jgi:hypothetical protein
MNHKLKLSIVSQTGLEQPSIVLCGAFWDEFSPSKSYCHPNHIGKDGQWPLVFCPLLASWILQECNQSPTIDDK